MMMGVMYELGKLYDVPITDLRPDPNQPRKSLDPVALADLTASIKQKGILEPILFRGDPESPFWIIVAGERRFRAAQDAGLFTIPGIYIEGNTAEIALIENLQRQDITCIEEAEALQRLMDDAKYTHEQLAAVIGKPRSTITDSLCLTSLPLEIRDDCRADRTLSKKKLIEISRKKQQRSMISAYARYKEQLRKEAEGNTNTRVKLTPNASFCRALDEIRQRIVKIETADWSDEETQAADSSLTMLRGAIDNLLNPPEAG